MAKISKVRPVLLTGAYADADNREGAALLPRRRA